MRTRRTTLVAALALLGCGGERVVATALPIPSSPVLAIYPGGGDGQSGVVGSILPLPLIVQLTGVSGQTNGYILNFVVTSGGGSLFANVVQTGTPNAGIAKNQSGIAQNVWTLGPTAGTQTVEARLVDPRTGATLTQASFQATATAGPANSISLVAGQGQTATAGSAVTTAPSVRVSDAFDNPIASSVVNFTVLAGGGSLVGPASIATNASGIATLGGWILGTSAGTNLLSASASGLSGSPVSFTATGRVGVATQLIMVTGNAQRGEVGLPISVQPAVQVRDANGNGVGGVAVTFAAMNGSSIDGIATLTTLTDQNGRISVPWAMGSTAGAHTLRVSALGLAGSPLTFSANAFRAVYVANQDSHTVTVFDPEAEGDAAPIRSIVGPSTGLNTPAAMTRDGSGQLWVTNYVGGSITVYSHGASGNAAPLRTIGGSATGLFRPFGIACDSIGQVYVFDYNTHLISVFAPNASGNVMPIRTIGGPAAGMNGVPGLLLSAGELYVTDQDGQNIKVFSATASGDQLPLRTISGPATGLAGPGGLQLDAAGNIYVNNFGNHSITVYAPGAVGDVTPIRTITGGATQLARPAGMALDALGRLYVANYGGPSVTSYAVGANGNVAPLKTIAGGSTLLNHPGWLTF